MLYFLFVSVLIWTQWFRPDHIIAGGDYLPPLKPWELISKVLYAWSPDYLGTESFMEITKIFPYYMFWGIFDLLGFSPFTIERFWFIFLNLLGGLGLLYFLKIFFPELKSVPVKLTVVTFYLFNLVVVTEFNHDTALFAYYSLPLVSGALIFALKKKTIKSLAVFVLASTFLFAVAANPGVFVVVVGVLISFLIIEFFELKEGKRKSFMKRALLLGIAFVVLNSFWIFTTIAPLFEEQLMSPFGKSHLGWDWVVEKSNRASFFNLFRLLGKFSWYSGFYSEPTFSFAPVYREWFMTVSTFFVPFIALSSLLLSRKTKLFKKTLWLVLFLLIFLFVSKGAHEPIPEIFHFLFVKVPGFQVFREPYTKLIIAFPLLFSCLLAIACKYLFNFLSSRRRFVFSLLILIVINFSILLNAWPLLSGEHTLKNRVKIADYMTELPAYWFEASDYINSSEQDITNLYVSPPGNYLYKWGYGGHPFNRRLVFVPRVQGRGVYGSFVKDLLLEQYSRAIVEENDEKFLSLSNLLRIDTFLQRNDLDWIWNGLYLSRYQNTDVTRPSILYEEFLLRQDFLEERRSFEELKLIQRTEGKYGFVSIPEKVIYFTSKNIKSALAFFEINLFSEKDLVLFEHDLEHLDFVQRTAIQEQVNSFVVFPEISDRAFKKGEFSQFSSPYLLKIARTGDYEIYVRRDGTLWNTREKGVSFIFNSGETSEEISFTEDNFVSVQDSGGEFLNIATINLRKGEYQLSLFQGEEIIAPLSYDDVFFVHDTGIESSAKRGIQVDKISPTKFDISLKNSESGPLFLTFHQSFTPQWSLGGLGRDRSVQFRSNFYANTWFINDLEESDHELSIVYNLQRYFAFFLFVSGSLILISIISIFSFSRKE